MQTGKEIHVSTAQVIDKVKEARKPKVTNYVELMNGKGAVKSKGNIEEMQWYFFTSFHGHLIEAIATDF